MVLKHVSSPLVGVLDSGRVGLGLLVDSVDEMVLIVNFLAGVDGHVAKIPDHVRNVVDVFFHFLLAIVVRDPGDVVAADHDTVSHIALRMEE